MIGASSKGVPEGEGGSLVTNSSGGSEVLTVGAPTLCPPMAAGGSKPSLDPPRVRKEVLVYK